MWLERGVWGDPRVAGRVLVLELARQERVRVHARQERVQEQGRRWDWCFPRERWGRGWEEEDLPRMDAKERE